MDQQSIDAAFDKRMALVGRRISGYCGHVPMHRALAPPSDKAATVEHIYNQHPASHPGGPQVSYSPCPADLPSIHRVPPRRVSQIATPASSHMHIKAVSGYGGHRGGHATTATGCSINGPRKTEILSTSMHAEFSTAWKQKLAGAEPLPKYPILRGPTRSSPLGHDCFLTN